MDLYEFFEWLLSYANGMSLSFALALGVFVDTLLGSSWRKANGLKRNSHGFFKGFLKNMSLAFIPATFWLANIILFYLPPDPTHPQFRYNPLMFDFISIGSGIFIGDWLVHSILANWKLSGHTISPRLEQWIQEEYDSKIDQHELPLEKLGENETKEK